MINWKIHRIWVGGLILASLIAVAGTPLLGMSQQKLERKLVTLRETTEKTEQAARQLQEDIAATQKLKTKIKANEVEQSLAPVDRLRVAQIVEHRAMESHLTHFTYVFSPEEKTVIDTVGEGKQMLATSKLSLAADAPTDTEAYQFLEALRQSLPGRLTWRDMTMQRLGTPSAPMTDGNIHLTARGEWLSNGASADLMGTGK